MSARNFLEEEAASVRASISKVVVDRETTARALEFLGELLEVRKGDSALPSDLSVSAYLIGDWNKVAGVPEGAWVVDVSIYLGPHHSATETLRAVLPIRTWSKKMEAEEGAPSTTYSGLVQVSARLFARVLIRVSGLPSTCRLVEDEVTEPETVIPVRVRKTYRIVCGPEAGAGAEEGTGE